VRIQVKDRYGMWKGRYILLIGVVVAAVVVSAIGGVVATVESHECALAARQLHRPSSYHFLGGCYVGIGAGQKVPLENYNSFRNAK